VPQKHQEHTKKDRDDLKRGGVRTLLAYKLGVLMEILESKKRNSNSSTKRGKMGIQIEREEGDVETKKATRYTS